MKIVVAIGGSILLKEYDCKKFQEYSAILKDLSDREERVIRLRYGLYNSYRHYRRPSSGKRASGSSRDPRCRTGW